MPPRATCAYPTFPASAPNDKSGNRPAPPDGRSKRARAPKSFRQGMAPGSLSWPMPACIRREPDCPGRRPAAGFEAASCWKDTQRNASGTRRKNTGCWLKQPPLPSRGCAKSLQAQHLEGWVFVRPEQGIGAITGPPSSCFGSWPVSRTEVPLPGILARRATPQGHTGACQRLRA